MKTTRKVIFENRKAGIKIYKNKHNRFEIIKFGKNVITPDSQDEFYTASVFINGIRVKRLDGKEMCFLFNQSRWFILSCGTSIFTRIFPFGEIAVSINGEPLHNHKVNPFFINLTNNN